jgi:mannitol-1-phosphate/altronate dehydrogenase
MAIPEVRHHLEQLLATEAIPTLREIPGHPASDYAETVCYAGFENTGVRDQIARLCIDGTAKFPSFLIPTIDEHKDSPAQPYLRIRLFLRRRDGSMTNAYESASP